MLERFAGIFKGYEIHYLPGSQVRTRVVFVIFFRAVLLDWFFSKHRGESFFAQRRKKSPSAVRCRGLNQSQSGFQWISCDLWVFRRFAHGSDAKQNTAVPCKCSSLLRFSRFCAADHSSRFFFQTKMRETLGL